MKRAFAMVIAASFPFTAAAQFWEDAVLDCATLPENTWSREVCDCSEIDSAVARLECFDNVVDELSASRERARLAVESLTVDRLTRAYLDGYCIERVQGMQGRLCEDD